MISAVGSNIKITLVGDGSSDEVLIEPLKWLLDHLSPEKVFEFEFCAHKRTRWKLKDKIDYAIELYPCDLLMVHRDVENQSIADREEEIRDAVSNMQGPPPRLGFIPVTPIKMSEAWLLINEQAIREAAGNPNGKEPLDMPGIHELELIDAKKKAEELLRTAHGGGKRQQKKFKPRKAIHLLAKKIEDYELCHKLSAFQRLQHHLHMQGFLPE